MMWNYGSGGSGWIWMTLMMVVFVGGLIAVALWAIRAGLGARGRDPMDLLRGRLAAGDISQEDFENTKRILQG